MTNTSRTAPTDSPILDLLANRWSTRSFDGTVDEAKLQSALEAARWSPSAYNDQPWRFIVARKGSESFAKIVASMSEFNQMWASNAGALIVGITDTDGKQPTNTTAEYDLGQTIAHFTIQAQADGLSTHQMSGFDASMVASDFSLTETQAAVSLVAVGNAGTLDALHENLQPLESAPRQRRPIADSVLVND